MARPRKVRADTAMSNLSVLQSAGSGQLAPDPQGGDIALGFVLGVVCMAVSGLLLAGVLSLVFGGAG